MAAPTPSRMQVWRAWLTSDGVQWVLAVLAPVAVALLLVPARDHLTSADDALILVVVTVAIASAGTTARSASAGRPTSRRRSSSSRSV